ncbi:hypothetical protein CRG98_002372 [Punica granatum]|uniref:Uncharacterized protein n=1 Tax=Punica granatum TaxID=22663 RepID=A0A2I0L990_PUNGR|nr:hypothetical protein CRG98_002372 [Punica granatum]
MEGIAVQFSSSFAVAGFFPSPAPVQGFKLSDSSLSIPLLPASAAPYPPASPLLAAASFSSLSSLCVVLLAAHRRCNCCLLLNARRPCLLLPGCVAVCCSQSLLLSSILPKVCQMLSTPGVRLCHKYSKCNASMEAQIRQWRQRLPVT